MAASWYRRMSCALVAAGILSSLVSSAHQLMGDFPPVLSPFDNVPSTVPSSPFSSAAPCSSRPFSHRNTEH
eukprot:365323-Chlamydomonas_euryale.AAC.12